MQHNTSTNKVPKPWIEKAKRWRNEHSKHVLSLEKTANTPFPPSKEDQNHPELWKAGSWLWLRQETGGH